MIIIINLTFSISNEFFMTQDINKIINDRNISDALLDLNFMKALFAYVK